MEIEAERLDRVFADYHYTLKVLAWELGITLEALKKALKEKRE